MFSRSFPIIATPDLAAAMTFYGDLLGGIVTYRFPDEGDPVFVSLDVGGSTIGLGHDPSIDLAACGPQRISLWVDATDCAAAVERLRAGGVRVLDEPERQPWGERVARVADPDGNVVVIGSP